LAVSAADTSEDEDFEEVELDDDDLEEEVEGMMCVVA